MEKYPELRGKYPEFVYRGYDIEKSKNETKVIYHFEIPGLSEFDPYWIFPGNAEKTDKFLLDNMVFNLGMAELISYWKIACPPRVRILCGGLDVRQAAWWKKLYFNGLGEFFYVNSINADSDSFMKLISEGAEKSCESDAGCSGGVLIPVGGGKDSAVTIELLSKYGGRRVAYVINSRGATEATVKTAGLDAYRVKRTLDKRMLELNAQGFLNGHTPFSAIVAFSSLISASIAGLRYVALSNESSANEATVSGSSVNHQYSKSFEFENDFVNYEKEYIGSGIRYFSFLRPLSEYQIAGLFSEFTAYHDVFRSCNAGSKTDS